MSLYRHLNEWRQNPHWSFSCCLAVLLPLVDLHGEIGGMAETNVLDDQLQTGQIETAGIFSAVKDSGAVDISIEGDQQNDDKTMETMEVNDCQDAEFHNKKFHKETQTEFPALFDINDTGVVDGLKIKPLEKSLPE